MVYLFHQINGVILCVVCDMFIIAFITKSAMSVVVPAHFGVPLDAFVGGAVFCLKYFINMLFLAVVLKLTITCLECLNGLGSIFS